MQRLLRESKNPGPGGPRQPPRGVWPRTAYLYETGWDRQDGAVNKRVVRTPPPRRHFGENNTGHAELRHLGRMDPPAGDEPRVHDQLDPSSLYLYAQICD